MENLQEVALWFRAWHATLSRVVDMLLPNASRCDSMATLIIR